LQPTTATLRIVRARRADLDAIMEIERLSFRAPWSRRVFEEELGRDFAYLKVVRDGDRVAAFVNYWVVADEIHILNVATHPEWRRRGIARRMMEHVMRAARLRRSSLLTLEVRRANLAAQELYRSLGFEVVGVRPRYYENNEDALVMSLSL
jgi:ribosomal-protein-alanine N-acetyltransferase